MLRFNKYLFGFLATAVAASACLGIAKWARWVLAQDPFETYKSSLGENVGIALKGVRIQHFQNGKKVSHAWCETMEVDKNRIRFVFNNVRDGVTQTQDAAFHFEALQANWDEGRRQLLVNAGGRVWNKDLNLKTQAFAIDRDSGILLANSPIDGTLSGGVIHAATFKYNTKSKDWEGLNPDWEGELKQASQEAGTKTTRWRIKSDGLVKREGDIEYWPKATAKTSDGDVIIHGDQVERNVKTDVVTAIGNVKYFSTKVNMTCAKAIVYRKEKRSLFTDNVRCYFKPESEQKQPVSEIEVPPYQPDVPDDILKLTPLPPAAAEPDKEQDEQLRTESNTKKYPTKALAARVEYWYGKGNRHAVITGKPQATQELPRGRWRRVWTTKALYDGEKETLRLVGEGTLKQTRVKTSWGDDLVCTWFEVSTKEGDESWTAEGMDGDVIAEDEESKSDDGGKGRTGGKPEPAKPAPKPLPGTLKV